MYSLFLTSIHLYAHMAGIDGKFNDGARKALNYLLYGCSGLEIFQASRNNPELDEVKETLFLGAF